MVPGSYDFKVQVSDPYLDFDESLVTLTVQDEANALPEFDFGLEGIDGNQILEPMPWNIDSDDNKICFEITELSDDDDCIDQNGAPLEIEDCTDLLSIEWSSNTITLIEETSCFYIPLYSDNEDDNQHIISLKVCDSYTEDGECPIESFPLEILSSKEEISYEFSNPKGKNYLLGFPVLPYDENSQNPDDNYELEIDENQINIPITDLLNSGLDYIEDEFNGFIGQGVASSQFSPSTWLGSLNHITPTKSYWAKVGDLTPGLCVCVDSDSEDDIDECEGFSPAPECAHNFELNYDGYMIDPDIIYTSASGNGATFSSFGCLNPTPIGDAMGSFSGDYFSKVIGEGVAASYISGVGWVGSIGDLIPMNGYILIDVLPEAFEYYWSCSDEDVARFENSNTIVDTPEDVSFIQSTEQAFYFAEDVLLNGQSIQITGDQWIVSYCDNNVVGSRQWLGEIVDIPVMGNDGNEYSDTFCKVGEIPGFKLYDANSGQYIDLRVEDIPEWSSNGVYMIGTLSASEIAVPESFILSSIYPNPFNPVTNIEFGIPNDMNISIAVYDISGREIESIYDGMIESGFHTITWNADIFSSGVYFLKVTAGNKVHTRKLMLIK